MFNLIPKKKQGNFNDLVKAYFQFFICLLVYEDFLTSIFCKVFLALPNRIHLILKRLGKHYEAMKTFNH